MDKQQNLFDLIKEVAGYLPSGWSFNEDVDRNQGNSKPELLGPNGTALTFRLRRDLETTICVSCKWPKLPGDNRIASVSDWGVLLHDESYPILNVKSSWKPKTTAKKLENKLLSKYCDLYMRCMEKRDKTILNREEVNNKVTAMKKAYPLAENIQHHNADSPRLYLEQVKNTGLNGVISFNESENLDIQINDLQLKDALKILKILNPQQPFTAH